MMTSLERTVRSSAGRIVGALAARFRDLDQAEDAFGDACEAAARLWPMEGEPDDPAAWLYRVAQRRAVDAFRRQDVRRRLVPEPPHSEPTPEDLVIDDTHLIPDERLRLIFVCCHPAIAAESRAALTLRLVCGLSADEIAAAFLLPVSTLLQRLTRAKQKIAAAGVSFEIPSKCAWPERVEAVLTTLEIAYAKAHADAAGAGSHAGYATEILTLTKILAELLPDQGEVMGLAALVRYAEARRSARVNHAGEMVPLSEQNPALWNRTMIADGNRYLQLARNLGAFGPRALNAAIHGAWCGRASLDQVAPWPVILALYDAMLRAQDDVIVRLNRAVALAEVSGIRVALDELNNMQGDQLEMFQPWHAVRADFLRRLGRNAESRAAYDRAIAMTEGKAEKAWLARRRP